MRGSCVEEGGGGGGERRAPNKAGPIRPPLLIGIKWECVATLMWT